jgi:hypothetical protein
LPEPQLPSLIHFAERVPRLFGGEELRRFRERDPSALACRQPPCNEDSSALSLVAGSLGASAGVALAELNNFFSKSPKLIRAALPRAYRAPPLI